MPTESHAPTDILLTIEDLAPQLDPPRSPKWVANQVRAGRFPHVRLGIQPPAGVREQRPIRFTPDQVDEIKALLVQHVPARQQAS